MTMVMESLDDEMAYASLIILSQLSQRLCLRLAKLLEELGCHHFFYDTVEPHLEIMHEGFMESMQHLLKGTSEALDRKLETAWDKVGYMRAARSVDAWSPSDMGENKVSHGQWDCCSTSKLLDKIRNALGDDPGQKDVEKGVREGTEGVWLDGG